MWGVRYTLGIAAAVLVSACGAGESASESETATVFYLNRDGAELIAGSSNNAALGVSSVLEQQRVGAATIAPSGLDDATWRNVVGCVARSFAQFNVDVVDERPEGEDFVMAVFGGTGREIGVAQDKRGMAPRGENCETVDDAVVYIFSDAIGPDVQQLCNVAAQEIGHTFGLDHAFAEGDLTSNLSYGAPKRFLDAEVPCGDASPRACDCTGATQNSAQILLERIGPAPAVESDTERPSLRVDFSRSKRASAVVAVRAEDDSGILGVALRYETVAGSFSSICGDNVVPCTTSGSEFRFSIADGTSVVRYSVTATDLAGNIATSAVDSLGNSDGVSE